MLMFLLLAFVSQHASGVEVEQGVESVLLPCQVPVNVSMSSTAAVWDQEELTKPMVHGRVKSGDDLSLQNDRYTNRTSMRADALQTGDLSLTLRNPTVSDSGTYTCTARKQGQELSRTEVQLKVTEAPPVWPKVLSGVLGTLLLLTLLCGLCVYFEHKRMKQSEVPQSEFVEVTQGVKSVLLPFKTTPDLSEDVTVEWTRTQPKLMTVHVYESGNNQPHKQDQGYRGRTEMKEDPLRTGDFSLTLKDFYLTDSGRYTCTVYNKDGNVLLQKSVTLAVRVPPPEWVEVLVVTEGEESALLPFKTTPDLPQDVTVEWTLTEPKPMKVHVYESGNNQPDKQDQDYRGRTEMDEDPLNTKDLSLTLKDLHLTDSGVYTCTVYNKDGLMLLQKSVTLNVRVPQTKMLEVTQGERSVLLPFKTTPGLPQDVTVEWALTQPKSMKVHVYESGNNQPEKQDQDYRGRTEMNEDRVKNKDLSLTLKNLRFTDRGVYTCTVYNKDGHMLLHKSLILSVRDVGMQMVVTQGLKFVMLPFKIPRDLPQGTTVEWRHNSVKVYKCKLIVISCCTEHQPRRDRAEMDGYPLTTGDFSLTLRDPHLTDSGVYTCTVNNTYRDILLQKVVTLSVRDNEVGVLEVTQGERSVLLPFQTTADLRQGVRVEWTRSDSKHTKVCVFQKSQSQADKQHQGYRGRAEMDEDALRTGDLSLTLKDLRLTDSGVYTCTVYNKDGHMLLQRVVTLSVRATLKGAMADMLARLRRRRRAPKSEIKVEKRNRNQEQERLTAEETV
ncbi:muscle M-line assembly protein unc-89 isoform X3 [Oreochromis niloticus]|uniref:muscle M-line assembly protein unc-89 isoform X3 n=1 Tax=Oreochromis niloticus TaxID=8128 RepID=UPI0009046A4B|nr:muscle M-line assembly protein unc-89 isoform X3 [Oreochromis niloticus]